MRKKRWWLPVAMIGVALSTASCVGPTSARQARLSAAVRLMQRSPDMQNFLRQRGESYMQAYFRFEAGMPDDVIMFIDQELLEGLESPKHTKGGDWMSLVGVQPAGGVWVTAGTDATMKGKPSTDRNWKIYDLHQHLQPGAWYRLRVVSDFNKLMFKSLSISGPGLDQTIDLSGLSLDYPNYMPFDRAGMAYFVGAMRSQGMAKVAGTPIAYFDNAEGGTVTPDGKFHPMFSDSFETQNTVGAQPLTGPPIVTQNYDESKWYLERDESIFQIVESPFALSGTHVGAADANLN